MPICKYSNESMIEEFEKLPNNSHFFFYERWFNPSKNTFE